MFYNTIKLESIINKNINFVQTTITPILYSAGSITGVWDLKNAINSLKQKELKNSAISFGKAFCKVGIIAFLTYQLSQFLFKTGKQQPSTQPPKKITFKEAKLEMCVNFANMNIDKDALSTKHQSHYEDFYRGCFSKLIYNNCPQISTEMCQVFVDSACKDRNQFLDLCQTIHNATLTVNTCLEYKKIENYCQKI